MEQPPNNLSGIHAERNTRPLGKQAQVKPSWLERVATRKAIALILSLSLVLLVLASLGGYYFWNLRQQAGVDRNLAITPPASLAELATQYPELAPILGDTELDSAYKDFMLAYQQGGPEAALELARQRGLVNDNDELRITLELDTEDHTALVAQLKAQGILVTAAHGNLIDLAVPLQLIEDLAQNGDLSKFFAGISELEHVKRIRLPRPSIQHDLRLFEPSVFAPSSLSFNPRRAAFYRGGFSRPFFGLRLPYPAFRAGDNEIESLDMLNVPAWHAAGFTGAGLKIGILDMGFNTYRSFLGTELPENVTVRSFIAGTEIDNTDTEHGAACAEIIHDIAPGAELFFAAYETDVEQFQAIDWLVAQGVNIISHSAGSILGPMDGSGPQAVKVDEVVAGGIFWANSAGNMGDSHYRGEFVDEDGDGFHEFKPGDELLGFIPDGRIAVALNWDAWDTGNEDYDLYIMDSDKEVVVSSKNTQNGPGDEAAEFISYFFIDNGPYYLAFHARRYTRPAIFDLYVYNAVRMEYINPEYSITTPADSLSAITVGATYWEDDQLEEYSSQGPSHDERTKPDISAPAGVSSAVYGKEFYGTSASAPHVAAAAALVWQANPDFSVQQVQQYLKDNALDLGDPGADSRYGYGRLYLGEAAASGAPPPTVEIPTVESPTDQPPTKKPPTARPPRKTTPPEDTATPEPEPEYDLTLSTQDLLWITLGLLGCVALPGMIGLGGVVLVAVAWSRSRARRAARPPARPMPPRPAPRIPPAAYPPAAQPPRPPAQGDYLPTVAMPDAGLPAQGKCARCGAPHRPGARFCNVCGNILSANAAAAPAVHCTSCGMALRPAGKFCPRCGKPR